MRKIWKQLTEHLATISNVKAADGDEDAMALERDKARAIL